MTVKEQFPAPSNRMVFWYLKGQTNLEPRVAIVTSIARGGILDLTIFTKDRQTLTTANGVRHKDDPYLISRPMHAADCGCWDYLPEHDPRSNPVQLSSDSDESKSVGPTFRKNITK